MSCCDSCAKGHGCESPALPELELQQTEPPVPKLQRGTSSLAERLGLSQAEVTASEAVSIEGSNAVRVDVIVVNLTLSSVSIRVQVSNDAVSWSDAAQFSRKVIGYATTKVRGIGFRFVRLYYEASNTAGGEGVLAASLHHWRN